MDTADLSTLDWCTVSATGHGRVPRSSVARHVTVTPLGGLVEVTEGSRHDDGAALTSGLVDTDEDRSGVILLRAWLHEGQVVARIHSSVSWQQEQQAGVALGIGEIERTVHEWLRDLAMTQP